MKQHITREQIDELTFDEKKTLFESLFPKIVSMERNDGTAWRVYDINNEYLTIGRMIEFLDEKDDYFKSWYKKGGEGKEVPSHTNRVIEWEYGDELCNVLWEAVKEELHK